MTKREPTQPVTQKTEKGLEIPIPAKRDVLTNLTTTARPKAKPKRARRRRTK